MAWTPSRKSATAAAAPSCAFQDPAIAWPEPPPGDVAAAVSCRRIESLPDAQLTELLDIERDAFPPCERLGTRARHLSPARLETPPSAPPGAGFKPFVLCRSNGLVVAQMGATLAGYLLFARMATSGLISKLAVALPFRRRGIGGALLQRGVTELMGTGRRPPSEIILHVDPQREGARALYERCGFRAGELLPGYYADAPAAAGGAGARDALVMRRTSEQSLPTSSGSRTSQRRRAGSS